MSYLLDTDVVANYLKGKQEAIALLRSLEQQGLAISFITYGELYEGIYYGMQRTEREAGFRAFLETVEVLTLNAPIVEHFARIRGELRRTGNLISDFDILIGATALHHGLTLVTGNVRHFGRIPDLSLLSPPLAGS